MANLTKITIIKLVELILVIVLLVLHFQGGAGLNANEHTIATTAVGGYLIILIGIFAGAITGTPINRRLDLYFTLVGCILFLVTGILIFQSGGNQTVRAVLAIVEGVLLLVDAVFTFRGEA